MGSCDGLSSSPHICGNVSWCLDPGRSHEPPTGSPPSTGETAFFSNQSPELSCSVSVPSPRRPPQEASEETNAPFNLSYPRKQLTRRKCIISRSSRHNPENTKLTDQDKNAKLSQAAVINKKEPSHSSDENVLLPRSSPVMSRRSKPISWQEKETSPSTSLSMMTSGVKEDVEPLVTSCHQPSETRVEDKKPSVSPSSDPNSFLCNQGRAKRTPQRVERQHRGRSLNGASTPKKSGLYSSAPYKDRSCSDILEFPADMFKTSCELEKENAHFVVVDMMLEVLEGAKWTLSCDSMMVKHCTVCSKRQTNSEQRDPACRRSGQAHNPGQSFITSCPQHSGCKRRLLDDETGPSWTDACADLQEHSWGEGHEESEADDTHQQTKSPSILSTDSGFEDSGVGTVLMPTDYIRNAEWLAQQLVLEFKRKWLPSHALRRGRLSLRSSLQELPGTEGVEVKTGSLTEEIRLRTRMRGTLNWEPPSFQIIFSIPPQHRRSEVVALQNHLCAGCGTEVEPRYIKKLRYCEYLGRYFCDCCHSGSEAVIPGRVLANWDFSRYSVSDFSKELLESVWCQPLFDLISDGKALYSKVKELDRFRELREQLIGIKKLLKACRLSERLLVEFELLPEHLLGEPLLFSMDDLHRAKKGQLVAQARTVLNSAMEHVKNCELCMGRGFICEFCRVKDIIFPFQKDICKRCAVCKACFHIQCFMGKKCPKCTRIQSRTKVQIK